MKLGLGLWQRQALCMGVGPGSGLGLESIMAWTRGLASGPGLQAQVICG
jgi:hypothetical protein